MKTAIVTMIIFIVAGISSCVTAGKLVRVQGQIPDQYNDCILILTKPLYSHLPRPVEGNFDQDYTFHPSDVWADVEIDCGGIEIMKRRYDTVFGTIIVEIIQ